MISWKASKHKGIFLEDEQCYSVEVIDEETYMGEKLTLKENEIEILTDILKLREHPKLFWCCIR